MFLWGVPTTNYWERTNQLSYFPRQNQKREVGEMGTGHEKDKCRWNILVSWMLGLCMLGTLSNRRDHNFPCSILLTMDYFLRLPTFMRYLESPCMHI